MSSPIAEGQAGEVQERPLSPSSETFRREMIDYRKWVVSIVTFVLATSIPLAGLSNVGDFVRWTLLVGWVALAFAGFINWVLIKSLMKLPRLIAPLTMSDADAMKINVTLHRRDRRFGNIQNGLFLFGCFVVAFGFCFHLFFDERAGVENKDPPTAATTKGDDAPDAMTATLGD